MNELGGTGLNERACLMLLWGDSKPKDAAVFASFEKVAKELIDKWAKDGLDEQPVHFYTSTGGMLWTTR